MFLPVKGVHPKVGQNCFVAPDATLTGNVVLGDQVSVWFRAVLRGDVMPIRIGARCNIQDGVIIHGTYQSADVQLADEVSVGHGAILHGCHVGQGALIGMGAIVMDHVKVGKGSLVAAGSLLTPGQEFGEGMLIMGRPAKEVRPLKEKERENLQATVHRYLEYVNWYELGGEDDGN